MVDPKLKTVSSVKIVNVRRRAKYIVMELDDGHFIITHLGMTGHFHFRDRKQAPGDCEKYMVSKFLFSDGSYLTHNSIRKFGKMRLADLQQLQKISSKLGAEPLDEKFTLPYFNELLWKRLRANIKAVLMDQQAIAGVGNIYAQEALYHAGVSPLRKAGSLSADEIRSLYSNCAGSCWKRSNIAERRSIITAIWKAEAGSRTILRFIKKNGVQRTILYKKIVVGGRGTTYCPKCQR